MPRAASGSAATALGLTVTLKHQHAVALPVAIAQALAAPQVGQVEGSVMAISRGSDVEQWRYCRTAGLLRNGRGSGGDAQVLQHDRPRPAGIEIEFALLMNDGLFVERYVRRR